MTCLRRSTSKSWNSTTYWPSVAGVTLPMTRSLVPSSRQSLKLIFSCRTGRLGRLSNGTGSYCPVRARSSATIDAISAGGGSPPCCHPNGTMAIGCLTSVLSVILISMTACAAFARKAAMTIMKMTRATSVYASGSKVITMLRSNSDGSLGTGSGDERRTASSTDRSKATLPLLS